MNDSDEKSDEGIRVPVRSANEVMITSLVADESEVLVAALQTGNNWISVDPETGRLVSSPRLEPLPKPYPDVDMVPFWSRATPEEVSAPRQLEFHEFMRVGDGDFPSIFISGLGAGSGSKDGYVKNAEILEGYGFSCMRSQRGTDGNFWEVWYLPGFFCAKGELKDCISALPRASPVGVFSQVLNFLCKYVNFGSLHASVQRVTLSYD